MYDYKSVKKWTELTEHEKENYYQKFNTIISFLKEHNNITLPWKRIDEYVGHIYRFTIDDWNAMHYDPVCKLTFDDVGMKYSSEVK